MDQTNHRKHAVSRLHRTVQAYADPSECPGALLSMRGALHALPQLSRGVAPTQHCLAVPDVDRLLFACVLGARDLRVFKGWGSKVESKG